MTDLKPCPSAHEIALRFAERFQATYPEKESILTLMEDLRHAIEDYGNRRATQEGEGEKKLRVAVDGLDKADEILQNDHLKHGDRVSRAHCRITLTKIALNAEPEEAKP